MKKGGREMIKKFNISKILLSFFIILGLGYFVFSGIPVKKVYASGMFGLEVKGGAYFQNLSGHLAVGNGGTVITPSLLGLQTTKTEPMLKVALYLLYDNRISFTYVPYLYSGSTTISQKSFILTVRRILLILL
jgi:hypothetical protein